MYTLQARWEPSWRKINCIGLIRPLRELTKNLNPRNHFYSLLHRIFWTPLIQYFNNRLYRWTSRLHSSRLTGLTLYPKPIPTLLLWVLINLENLQPGTHSAVYILARNLQRKKKAAEKRNKILQIRAKCTNTFVSTLSIYRTISNRS